jgi:hypothetical protein
MTDCGKMLAGSTARVHCQGRYGELDKKSDGERFGKPENED